MNVRQQLQAALAVDRPREGRSVTSALADLLPRTLTPAAVLIPIIARPQATVLLTRRADHLRQHRGQISFPGGRRDPEDQSLVETALRETHEELDLSPDGIEVIGQLASRPTITGYQVLPVVGLVQPELRWQPYEGEVAEAFELPLADVADPAAFERHRETFRGKLRAYYSYDHGNHHIWGATAAMLRDLMVRLQIVGRL